jgi:hypothetical protein
VGKFAELLNQEGSKVVCYQRVRLGSNTIDDWLQRILQETPQGHFLNRGVVYFLFHPRAANRKGLGFESERLLTKDRIGYSDTSFSKVGI